ncbi:helix-turn-helix domain-containing protein [Hydrogenophaga sp. OTU3427]|uniref:helix-turn-helix domain-containing protein n=1 Tax=Hydrogenophaga sp. OTU3427 TaxID=3043856 RepID=UPI00406CBBA7
MDGIDIAYRLKRLGLSQSDIARDLGVSASVVGNVIHGRISSFQVACHVANLLGMPPSELWPQRYTFRPRGRSPRRRGEATGGTSMPTD